MTKSEVLKSKVCLVGEAGVGKTSLIRRFVLDVFSDEYIRTLGAKVTKKSLPIAVPERNLRFEVSMAIWDVIGHAGFRDLLSDSFFLGAQGILAVADLTRKETLPSVAAWVSAVEKVAGRVPVVLVGNKADLEREAQFGERELAAMARSIEAAHVIASAKSGQNVEQAFRLLATAVTTAPPRHA